MKTNYTNLTLSELYSIIAKKTVALNSGLIESEQGPEREELRKEIQELQSVIEKKRRDEERNSPK